MTSFVNPTYYNLQKATIRSEFSSFEPADVTSLIPRLSINSSIDSEVMFGTARFIDSVGLLEGDALGEPLRGEEQIVFEIADSRTINDSGSSSETSEADDPYVFVGFIYKIDNIETKEINDAIIYDVHFISYQSFKAGTKEIIRAFIDVPVSEVVQTIFADYYEDPNMVSFIEEEQRKELILEQTEGNIRCWIPRMRPEEAMGFLSKRAYSSESPSCTFRFFENSKGYHFVTDEELFRLASNDDDNSRLFKFTYLDAIPNTLEFFEDQLNNLETLENTSRVNSLSDIYHGAYKNKVIELDILSRRLNLLGDAGQYNYFDRRDSYFDTKDNEKLQDRHTPDFINTVHSGEEDVQKKWIVIKNYTDQEGTGENAMQAQTFYPEIISNRQAYSKHIESITVGATGPGRFDITAGDIVDLSVKEFQHADGENTGSFEENKHLSGRYIVRSISHVMTLDEMKNHYTLIKKDWAGVDEL